MTATTPPRGTPVTHASARLADAAAADARARARALDVRHSFLVQAPAGSGKTGLLIQRMLALLAAVERPEQILAMTFTRKAAAEMRERVLHALRDAQARTPVPPQSAHEARTRELADGVLAQDARRGWQLLANPARLRIVTIDAVAAGFARQVPIATRLGAMPAFVDDASAHYRAAALAALADAGADDDAWRRFLMHLDNDAPAVVTLLAQMLARREQWRAGPPLGAPDEALRANLEAALQAETAHALRELLSRFPPVLAAALPELLRHAAAHLASAPSADAAGFAGQVALLARQHGLPAADADALPSWRALADWLLTKSGPQWRAKVDKNQGFPPGEKPRSGARAAAKAAMTAWLADAADVPGLAESLHAVRTLPPAHYDEHAWAFVAATLALLPQLAAHLTLEFARTGETDFSEATLRALAALGDAEAPGELLLAADMRIAHLLVDEFQDTSWTHNELLGRLTSGWEGGDGRTLFAVGDPMQSIYRFRAAEVGIFLAAQAQGRINDVPVECLTLARNFRSQAAVVDWVNEVFPQVLGRHSDASRGQVAYEKVLPTRGAGTDPVPTVTLLTDAQRGSARSGAARRPGAGRGSARHRDPRACAQSTRRDPAGAAPCPDCLYRRRRRAARRAPGDARSAGVDACAHAAGRHARRTFAAARAVVRTDAGRPARRGRIGTNLERAARRSRCRRCSTRWVPTAGAGSSACEPRWRPRSPRADACR